MPTIWGSKESDISMAPLSKAHRARATMHRRMWDYYKGNHRRPLVVKANQADDNVILNFSRRVVDKGLSFLFGQGVEFEIDASDGRTPEEDYLDLVWGTSEQKRRVLLDIGMNGGVTGTSFARLYLGDKQGDLPRIAALDSSLMDVITSPDDIDDVLAYHMVWRADRTWKRHRIDVQVNGTWVITEEENTQASTWKIVNETLWPYQFAPVFMCQNLPDPNSVWGVSDLIEADINDAINWTASNINRILRFHAHPKTIGTGFGASQLQNTSVDQFWSIDSEGAKVYNLEMQSDLASAYQMLVALKDTYSKVTGVPDIDSASANFGQLSGFAMKILYSDLLEKTNSKRVTYGSMLADINSALLEIVGRGAGLHVRNAWEDPLPSDEVAEVAALDTDRRNGLSQRTYLERRGYDAERETERNEEERNQQQTIGETMLRAFESGNVAQPRGTVSQNAASGT